MYFTVKNGLLLAVACIFSPFALSEVTLDGSMGTTGSLVGPDYQITEDLGQRSGGNLFHSFGQFNINSAESATFSGSAGINNVISRVTGGQASTIDGAFRSTIPGANVYFLNPSGVIFGENATLDVQGSFHASTADYLKFKDGVTFETGLANANPILTTASPEAFGFLNDAPASISVSGGNNKVLKVPENETLSLIGGDISIEDRSLYAPSGQVILASAGSTGEVVMNESGIGTSSFTKGGNIHLSHSQDNPVTIINDTMQIADIDVSADSAGSVVIRGGQMVMDNTNIWAKTTNKDGKDIDIGLAGALTINGSATLQKNTRTTINTRTYGRGTGGNLTVSAGSILIDGNNSPTGLESGSFKNTEGDAGDITLVTTGSFEVRDRGLIITSTFGQGDGGNLNVNAGSILIHGNDSMPAGLLSTSFSENIEGIGGNAGDITLVTTGYCEIRNGGQINTSTDNEGIAGNIKIEAGSILINANDLPTGIVSEAFSKDSIGAAGNITLITKDSFEVLNGGSVFTSTDGSGMGGKLTVDAGSILINGSNSKSGSALSSSSDEEALGSAGNIKLTTRGSFELSDGGKISSSTFGIGAGGDITVDAKAILIDGKNNSEFPSGLVAVSLLENSKGTGGKAGDIKLETTGAIELHDATIATATLGKGNGGKLTVDAGSIQMENGAILSTDSTSEKIEGGDAGNLDIKTDHLEIHDSEIRATTFGSGQGGNLEITSKTVFLNNNGIIQSRSTSSKDNSGKSGTITISVDEALQLKNNSEISVSTKQANAGEIEIKGEGNLQLMGDSSITTSVANGEGNGGNITVNSPIVSLDSSQIRAQAKRGLGGNISISGFLFQSPKSIISASSEISKDGELNLNPDTNISGSIAILPESLLNVSEQLNDRCNNRTGKNTNSFVVKGKGGIPLSPDKPVSSDFMDFLPTTNSPHNFLKNQNRHHLDNNYRLSSLSIDCILFSSSGK